MKSIRTEQVGRRQMLLQTLALAGVAAWLGACQQTDSGMSGPEKPSVAATSGGESGEGGGGDAGGGDAGGGGNY